MNRIKLKVKIFTHIDLDGVGCAILGRLAFGDNVDIEYCDYANINERIKEYIESKEYLNYEVCFITDISVNEEIEKLINETEPNEYKEGFGLNEHFQLIDHHLTAMHLNENFWCLVKTEDNFGNKVSATKLFFEHLETDSDWHSKIKHQIVRDFVNLVDCYDTWKWKSLNVQSPKKLNDLLYILGRDRFINSMLDKLTNKKYIFSKQDLLMLEIEREKIEKYIDVKSEKGIVEVIEGYTVGIFFAEQYISELGNRLSEINPHLDLIAIISEDKVSYRTVRSDINVSEFAKLFGGGGHPKASGSQIDNNIKKEYISKIFKL